MSAGSVLQKLDPAAQVAYWNRGLAAVPMMTGATGLQACPDLVDACRLLQVPLPLKGRVLDVGCGTGRWQRFCQLYIGLDISPSAVEFTKRRGLSAGLISGYGPAAVGSLVASSAEWVTCFSVFTHIDETERRDYLHAFRGIAPRLLVDIIPGDGGGDIALWTADVEQFEDALAAEQWSVLAAAERTSPGGVVHRYYRCERASGLVAVP